MKYLPQLLIICLFSFLGEVCHWLIPAPIPASIYGMILLFLSLFLKLLPVKMVEDSGKFLTGFLPLLFVVPIVDLLDHWDTFRSAFFPIVFTVIVTTVLVFAVSGWVTQALLKNKEQEESHD